MVVALGSSPAMGQESVGDLSLLPVSEVMKAVYRSRGHRFTLDEIESMRRNPYLAEHHRAILGSQMLSTVDDSERLRQSVLVADEYLELGYEDWTTTYMAVHRAFILHLLPEEREAAAGEFERLLLESSFEEMDEVDDPLIAEIGRHKSVSDSFNDGMRLALGSYYLDWAEEPDPAKAYAVFWEIRMTALRDERIEQIGIRGHDMEEVIREARAYPELRLTKEESVERYRRWKEERREMRRERGSRPPPAEQAPPSVEKEAEKNSAKSGNFRGTLIVLGVTCLVAVAGFFFLKEFRG